MPITDITAKSAKPQEKNYKITDEKGLYLLIHTNGGKYWRFKYRFANKEKMLAFGVYPEIPLKEAREKRDTARKLIREGIDPAENKKEIKRQQLASTENSFESIAREWHEKQTPGWTPRHATPITQ